MKKTISESVREAILPTVTELGYRIWDITFSKIGADYHLEITIDADNGIGIDDCEKVHRAIDPILDEKDPIEGFYYLEVSSPGLERDLRTDDHISQTIGQKVEVKLFSARDGRKSILATLAAFDGETITLSENDHEIALKKSEIAKIHTVYDEDATAADILKDNESTPPECESDLPAN